MYEKSKRDAFVAAGKALLDMRPRGGETMHDLMENALRAGAAAIADCGMFPSGLPEKDRAWIATTEAAMLREMGIAP